jgi:glucosamine-6-phosphate deaminase
MRNDDVLRLTALPLEELKRVARVKFRLLPDRDALLRDFADTLLEEVRAHNRRNEPTRLILPIGPIAQYRHVVEQSNRERLSWARVHVFGMDEFLDWQGRPIPLDHPLSFEGFMRREVFGRLDPSLRMPDAQIVFPNPFRIDEASDAMRRLGGIDCCFGGIGYHGHIAFNEPPLSRWHEISVEELRASLTRVVTLGDDSIVVQSIHCSGGNSAAIPPMAVTLGLRDILAARKLRLYCAAGERHRAIFRRTVAGEVSVAYPSTLIQGHPDAEVVTDVPTAERITVGLR